MFLGSPGGPLEPVRKIDLRAPPQTPGIRICVFNKTPGDWFAREGGPGAESAGGGSGAENREYY